MSRRRSQDYMFGTEGAELQRLAIQAAGWEPRARWLLDEIGLRPGSRAIDIGCGPVGILQLLSERVGAAGVVVGLEREHRFAEAARDEVRSRGLINTRVTEADIASGVLEPNSFDFAHQRFVLINIAERESVLADMIALVRPAGVFASEELDNAAWLCYPEHRSFHALFDAFETVFRAKGGDPHFGRRVPSLLRAAGLQDVRCMVHADLARPGTYRRRHLLALIGSFREKIIGRGVMSESALTMHLEALARHLDDPETMVIDQLLVQAWGRKPA